MINCSRRVITLLLLSPDNVKLCNEFNTSRNDIALQTCAFTMPVPPWVSHSVIDANVGNLGKLLSWAESQALGSDMLVAYKYQC